MNRWQQFWGRCSKTLESQLHTLRYVFWESTLRCNLSCKHCGSDCTKDETMAELPGDRVVEVFRDIADHHKAQDITVAVTGGEPLMRKDLFEVMTQVSDMGFPWGMVTNGSLVNEDTICRCANAGMKTVSVSLDGPEKLHNWLRCNEGSFERAINALNLFVKSGTLRHVDAITCVHSGNVAHLEEVYQLLVAAGVKSWRLFTIFPHGRAMRNPELLVNKEVLSELFAFIERKRASNPPFWITYSEEGYLGRELDKKVRVFRFTCAAGINIGGLLCDGSYGACPSLTRDWVQGHIDELTFSEAWEKRYKKMRNRNWMKNEYCDGCGEWKDCKASSLHLWNHDEHRPDVCHYRELNAT